MTAKAILDEIQPLGRDSYKKVLLNYGVTESCFGGDGRGIEEDPEAHQEGLSQLALEWIESGEDLVAVAGWATLGSLVAIQDDAELDLAELERLLQRVEQTIQQAPDAVRSQMNGFLIAVGCYVKPLTQLATEVGRGSAC